MSKASQDDAKLEAMEVILPEAKVDEAIEDWNYSKYIVLLTPSIIKSSVERGIQARNDMIDTVNWINEMSAEKQQSLTDLATGAVSMTKDAVTALTETTAKEYERISASVAEQGLSKTVQDTAIITFTKAQELYSAAMATATSITEDATMKAKLKREEVLASETLVAAGDWAEAIKKAIEENAIVSRSKAIGGDALRLAEESYSGALQYAEKKRVDTINLSLMYLAAAQDQMSAITKSEQGKKLAERTQKLIDLVKSMPGELLKSKSKERLDERYLQAGGIVKSAQDWVSAVSGCQKQKNNIEDQRLAAQFDLVEALESEV